MCFCRWMNFNKQIERKNVCRNILCRAIDFWTLAIQSNKISIVMTLFWPIRVGKSAIQKWIPLSAIMFLTYLLYRGLAIVFQYEKSVGGELRCVPYVAAGLGNWFMVSCRIWKIDSMVNCRFENIDFMVNCRFE